MSKASTSSLQHLLRQLYLAKPPAASIEGAAAAAAVISGGGSSGLSNSRSGGAASSFSTAAAARSLHHGGANDASPASSSSPSSSSQHHHHHHHAPLSASTSTGEWAATSSAAAGSNGSSTGSASKARNHAHHYHRHNAAHHHVSSSSSSLLPSFWMQSTPSSGTSTPSTSSSQSPPPPPLPPFSNGSTSSSSSSSSSSATPASYTHSPATSSSNLTSAAPSSSSTSSSQLSDHHYTSTTGQPSHPLHNADINDQQQQQQQNNKVPQPSLTLLPGAYGIPKRMSASGSSSSSSATKGKGKEVMDESSEALQAQIAQLRESMLSVQVGEDAYFVRHDALGVADGVGGWSGRRGADPGLFAARLMHHCSAELDLAERLSEKLTCSTNALDGHQSSNHREDKKSGSKLAFVSSASSTLSRRSTEGQNGDSVKSERREEGTNNDRRVDLPPEHYNAADTNLTSIATGGDPIEILHRAWDLTLTEFFELNLIGSSTALIVMLQNDELKLANIGDCCLSIIRDKQYIFRLQEQQHSFNYPFQIGTNSKDTPKKDSQFFNIKIEKGDLIILSSDGLVDNLFDEDILEEVERYSVSSSSNSNNVEGDEEINTNHHTDGSSMTNQKTVNTISPERLSKALCSRAKAVSEDQRAVTSPFQQRANEEGIHFVGGKHDDITVLVAVIGDKSDE